jgi:hypothetical protein
MIARLVVLLSLIAVLWQTTEAKSPRKKDKQGLTEVEIEKLG